MTTWLSRLTDAVLSVIDEERDTPLRPACYSGYPRQVDGLQQRAVMEIVPAARDAVLVSGLALPGRCRTTRRTTARP